MMDEKPKEQIEKEFLKRHHKLDKLVTYFLQSDDARKMLAEEESFSGNRDKPLFPIAQNVA